MKTIPLISTFALWTGLALLAVGQDPRPQEKKEDGGQKLDTLAKVAKNMESSEDRLKKADPGDVTRKIQRDIVDLLDELIKQNNQQSGQGGKSDKFSKSKSKSSQNQTGQSKAGQPNDGDPNGQSKQSNADEQDMDGPGRAKTGKDQGPQGKKKDKGKGNEKEGTGKDGGQEDKDGNEDKKGEAKDNQEGKDGSKQGGQGTAKNLKSNKVDLMADQHRSEWGHLPLTKRLEMDAYAKQRFMPRYDEALQEYYRTISEQTQRKK
jgi:hypothetical protein